MEIKESQVPGYKWEFEVDKIEIPGLTDGTNVAICMKVSEGKPVGITYLDKCFLCKEYVYRSMMAQDNFVPICWTCVKPILEERSLDHS